MGRIDAEADDVDRDASKRDRNLGTGDVGQVDLAGRFDGLHLSAQFIVVRQRPQAHPVGLGPPRECFGCECAVRNDGMAVQIGVDKVVHPTDCR
jgi:hypothetical protein